MAAIDLDAERCTATVSEITALGRRALAYGCDVSDENAVRDTVEQIQRDFGRIDILVNIAGITARVPTGEIEASTVRRLTEVNYYGTFWMCKEVGRRMLARGRRQYREHVGPRRRFSGHGTRKRRVQLYQGGHRVAHQGTGLRVGRQGNSRERRRAVLVSDRHERDEHLRQQALHGSGDEPSCPCTAIGQPHELVGPIVFLASEASSMITGLVLPVDGGAAATCPIEWKAE